MKTLLLFLGTAVAGGTVAGWLGPRRLPVQAIVCPPAQRRAVTVGPLPCDASAWLACEEALREASAEAPNAVTLSFDALPPEVGPDTLEAGLEAALADCGGMDDVIVTDCTSYPCAAALRGDTPCDVYRIPVVCPDGHTAIIGYLPLIDWETLTSTGLDDEDAYVGVLGARFDDIRRLWPCDP